MNTNQTIDGVSRELLEIVAGFVSSQADAFPLINVPRGSRSAGLDQVTAELRALLDRDKVNNRQMGLMQFVEAHPLPAAQPRGEPLIHITPEVLAMLRGERKMQPGGLTYSGSKPLCGWTVPLYTEQPAPVADSTTSDKYKAELYEEVWQLARGMGFSNVTDALMKAEKQHAPVAMVPEGYCIMPRQLTAENGAKALLLGEFKLQVTKECPECRELGEPTEGCDICDGEGEYGQQYTISWDQIKFIYSKAAEGLAVKAETDKL